MKDEELMNLASALEGSAVKISVIADILEFTSDQYFGGDCKKEVFEEIIIDQIKKLRQEKINLRSALDPVYSG